MTRGSKYQRLRSTYVDDVTLCLPILPKGAYWDRRARRIMMNEDLPREDSPKSDEKRSAEIYLSMFCDINPDLTFTVEISDVPAEIRDRILEEYSDRLRE